MQFFKQKYEEYLKRTQTSLFEQWYEFEDIKSDNQFALGRVIGDQDGQLSANSAFFEVLDYQYTPYMFRLNI